MICNSLVVDRKRLPEFKKGVFTESTYFSNTLGPRIFMMLDFIAIKEQDGTYTLIKNRANAKKSLTETELNDMIDASMKDLEVAYESVLRQYREEEERKAKEERIDFANKPWKPSNPPKQPKPDKPASKQGNKAKRKN